MQRGYKCLICKKKLKHLFIQLNTCRCNNLFCSYHKHDHNCSYNYKTMFSIDDKIKSHKIEKI